jgi:hypothetical protein
MKDTELHVHVELTSIEPDNPTLLSGQKQFHPSHNLFISRTYTNLNLMLINSHLTDNTDRT